MRAAFKNRKALPALNSQAKHAAKQTGANLNKPNKNRPTSSARRIISKNTQNTNPAEYFHLSPEAKHALPESPRDLFPRH